MVEPIKAGELYNSMAEQYVKKNESNLYNNYYERPATISLIPSIAGKTIFEAGCGGGTLLEWIVDQKADIIACDVSEALVRYSRNRIPTQADKIYVADIAEDLYFIADKSVDGIVSSLVLHYIEDWNKVFSEFSRILKDDGFIVFSTHHPLVDWKLADMDNYFEKRINEEIWKIGEQDRTVRFYHRPLTEYFEVFNQTQFYVEALLEPFPVAEGRVVNEKSYDYLNKNPHFLFIRLRKINL